MANVNPFRTAMLDILVKAGFIESYAVLTHFSHLTIKQSESVKSEYIVRSNISGETLGVVQNVPPEKDGGFYKLIYGDIVSKYRPI